MKHALFVTFHYPPESSSSGVLRTLKFSRYLPEYGWRVTVLAPDVKAYDVQDLALSEQVPSSVRVVRTRFLNTKKHLSVWGRYPALLAIPDGWIGWYPWAVMRGHRILAEDPVDLIFSTSPYATSHLIALRLSRSRRVPLVTDFRDPWFEDPPESGTPRVRQWFAPRLERRVVQGAARVVTSTRQLKEMLRRRYGDLSEEKFVSILNGYDEKDFLEVKRSQSRRNDSLLFVHAGSLNREFRDPRPLIDAVRRAATSVDGTLRIRLRFIGAGDFADSPELRPYRDDYGGPVSVEFAPRVPYRDVLSELATADVLLLLQASEDTTGLVPAKLYEYLRLQRPVLALVMEGAVTEVLADTGGAWSVDPVNPGALKGVIAEIIGLWKEGTLASRHARLDDLRPYERRRLTGELAATFDAAVRQ